MVQVTLNRSEKCGTVWVALPLAEDGKKHHAMHSRSLFQAVTGRSALSPYEMLAGFLKIVKNCPGPLVGIPTLLKERSLPGAVHIGARSVSHFKFEHTRYWKTKSH